MTHAILSDAPLLLMSHAHSHEGRSKLPRMVSSLNGGNGGTRMIKSHKSDILPLSGKSERTLLLPNAYGASEGAYAFFLPSFGTCGASVNIMALSVPFL
jgi:hypothetical protein